MNLRDKLIHAVTEWDRRQASKVGYNPHALGIYFQAIDAIMESIDGGVEPRAAIEAGFNDRLRDHCQRAAGLAEPAKVAYPKGRWS